MRRWFGAGASRRPCKSFGFPNLGCGRVCFDLSINVFSGMQDLNNAVPAADQGCERSRCF